MTDKPKRKASVRTEALRAAREKLAAREALIGEAAVANARVSKAEEELSAARANYGTAYDKALAGGWTPSELEQLGLTGPRTERTRRAAASSTQKDTVTAAAGDPEVLAST